MSDHQPGSGAAAHAQAAAEAIRGLNHATRSGNGLGQPSAAHDVPGSLPLAAARLGQAPAQVTRCPGQALAAGRPGHDLGQDPAIPVSAAGTLLGGARLPAAALAGGLGAAQQLALVNGRPRSRKDQP